MKDAALRHSILIVAKAHLARKDAIGDAVHKLLMSILDGTEILDKVLETKPARKRK
jgi:hypothetical protein